uniref:N-alpha-acetyltransferase 60 n=1 Tax=Hyaloperonospora arabidopsidis (strain Emoy2) TaxID=559515 RepID=M4BEK5_HYAAE
MNRTSSIDETGTAGARTLRVVALDIQHRVDQMDRNPLPVSSPQRVVYFRDLDLPDIPQVRRLHEEWFPIRYNQAFYDGAARGLWLETGGQLFARLAVEMHEFVPIHAAAAQQGETILGAVTASTLPLSKVEDPDLIEPDNCVHTQIMYILTLGTRASVRRMGIASRLLEECIAQACRQPECGAVYLHVKADNLSARHFYEKHGFQNLRYLQDYYMIDGVRHDAFLYIFYINGAAPQRSWLDRITSIGLEKACREFHDGGVSGHDNGETRTGTTSSSCRVIEFCPDMIRSDESFAVNSLDSRILMKRGDAMDARC